MRSITNVDPAFLGLLDSEAAVRLFRELLWAEASRIGLGPMLISVPGAITVSDGGIDAEVIGAQTVSPGGVILAGCTRYQVKTGEFSAGNKSEMKKLFLKPDGQGFNDRVRACFQQGHAFVGVLFGSDVPDSTDDQVEKACRDFVAAQDTAFNNARIKIVRQNQIAAALNQYPALALRAQMKSFPHLRTHKQWGEHEIENLGPLHLGPFQEGLVKQVRDELRRKDVSSHLCVWGEPGVGKTRLLYEATNADDLSASVVYFRSPKALQESGVVDELISNASVHAIVVVDDCAERERSSVWRQLTSLGSRVRLITVQHDSAESSGTTIAIPAPALAVGQISKIIQEQGVAKETAERFAPYCGGSPRVAEVVGSNLMNHPEDLTKPLDKVNVWDRFVEGGDDPASALVARRKLVLERIALFKRFGYSGQFKQEAEWIAALVERADPGVTWDNFQKIVYGLRQRRLLQGEATLYITPRLLHIKLWGDWWRVHGESLAVDQFIGSIPTTLHRWFYEMFEYAHSSAVVKETVRTILSTHGPFLKEGLIKTEVGANFFLSLTVANTEAALEALESTIGGETPDELLAFKDGRQRIVWALEKIAVERAFFPRAARLLLMLAEAENEFGYSNNASGTFSALFSLGPGRTAPTQAPPKERFRVLEDALNSSSKAQRSVALKACGKALDYGSFSRTAGAERRGLQELELWSPKTYGEWFAAYEYVWNLLRRAIVALPEDERSLAGHILLAKAPTLIAIGPLENTIMETITDLAGLPGLEPKALLECVVALMKRGPDRLKERLRQLEQTIIGGDDLTARLKRYLILPPWDLYSSDESSGDAVLESLAREMLESPNDLEPEFTWLSTVEPESAHVFGFKLGRLDATGKFAQLLLDALKRAESLGSSKLLGGYLRGTGERDPVTKALLIEEVSKDPLLKHFAQSAIWHAGLTNESAMILMELVKQGDIPPESLQDFMYGAQIQRLSEAVFKSWLELLLLDQRQATAVAAVDLLHSFVHPKEISLPHIPAALTQAVLLNRPLFQPPEERLRGSHVEHAWAELAQAFVDSHPETMLLFAERLLEGMGKDSVLLFRFAHSPVSKLLDKIVEARPREVWRIASSLLGPPIDSRAFDIGHWLRGERILFEHEDADSVLQFIPLDELWSWVDQDIEKRAWYLASFIPPRLSFDTDKPCLVREVLARYGDRDDVQENLAANFSTEGWTGSESAHYKGKIDRLAQLLLQESEPKVRGWLTRYISSLERSAKRVRLEEEREAY